ncbi:tRNA-dihydrouridine synthase [Thalassotalea ganghwensis]
MKIVLAPMEGVLDYLMRELLTEIGGYDLCVTEFVRVVDHLLPKKVFYRICPELKNNGYTNSGVPVRVQLLGQNPNWMAENALRAIELGSRGLDINFGCPAPTVNKSNGGSIMLKDPNSVYQVVKAVREALPNDTTVTAKIRLGYEDKSLAVENAMAVAEAGANELIIHARTKIEGYKPPAHWNWIKKVKSTISIPVTANGEIWSREDALKCQKESDCENIMLGRGALALPNLASTIKYDIEPYSWRMTKELIAVYSNLELKSEKSNYFPNRIKQWFRYLKLNYSEADDIFMDIRKLRKTSEILQYLT